MMRIPVVFALVALTVLAGIIGACACAYVAVWLYTAR